MTTTDDPLSAFADARASLRDNAKWVLSGTGALVVIVVGGTTISQVGALVPGSCRFWLAVGSGLFGLLLCAVPFNLAVEVLASELVSMRQFVDAKWGARKIAFEKVSTLTDPYLAERSVRKFVDAYEALLKQADDPDPTKSKAANDQIDVLKPTYDEIAQACMTQLVSVQFKRLINSLRMPGVLILLSFLVFAWAANPPKETNTTLPAAIVTLGVDADGAASLKAAGLDPVCYAPAARVLELSQTPAGMISGVLLPPRDGMAAKCLPTRVTVIGGQVRAGS